jgi:hypothetical protein
MDRIIFSAAEILYCLGIGIIGLGVGILIFEAIREWLLLRKIGRR